MPANSAAFGYAARLLAVAGKISLATTYSAHGSRHRGNGIEILMQKIKVTSAQHSLPVPQVAMEDIIVSKGW